MFRVLFLSLILFYFYYFYHVRSEPASPPSTALPQDPHPLDLLFKATTPKSFEFKVRNRKMWQHGFQGDTHWVKDEEIIERDDCYSYQDTVTIAATGLNLYEYLKKNPEFQNKVHFEEESVYTAQQGNVFYFTCVHRRIDRLDMCPSGTVFQNRTCVSISSCTDKPDDAVLPLLSDSTRYVRCQSGQEHIQSCQPDHFFYYNRCVHPDDQEFLCKFHPTTLPRKLNATTLFECQNFKPVYTTCAPGTEMVGDALICEPADCVGRADGTRLPMRRRDHKPFHFIPGHLVCQGQRVAEITECPAVWDAMASEGDDLTHLPMVWDGRACAIPTFGKTVFSDDPEVMVPVHEFTKQVQNWLMSPQYDRTAGYVATATGRKRQRVEPGQRIGMHFKVEPACPPRDPRFLPINGERAQFYNCEKRLVETCPAGEFFTGNKCRPEPRHAFQFRNLPLFSFDSLNAEEWMAPWDFPARDELVLHGCLSAEFRLLPLYNLCTRPECEKFAFLSMIPEMSLLLPQEHQAQCLFNEGDRHMEVRSVDFGYTFWDQKVLPENVNTPEVCTFGQTLKTGHFIWDSTIFATCDPSQPFLFCPSSRHLLQDGNVYACAPPPGNRRLHTQTHQWTGYAMNEVKRILPAVWDGTPYTFYLNRKENAPRGLPETGWVVPRDERVNLKVDRPLIVELRYRVTFPPHVAFEYDDANQLQILASDPASAFHVRSGKFSRLEMKFPRFKVTEHVELFLKYYGL